MRAPLKGFTEGLDIGVKGFFAFVLCAISFASPAAAVEYGGFGGRPAYPREDNPRTDSIFVHTIEPGEVVNEGVKVLNNTAERKTLEVYAADSVRSSGGGFACAQQSAAKAGVGAWVELEESIVTLDSATNKIIPFTISVPENASAGEHNGCILIQEVKAEPGQTSGVRLSFRTGLRIAITIPGELTRKLEIAGFSVDKQEDGDILLHPEVENLGNVSIDADVQVVTRSILGIERDEQGGAFPVLRGETSEWNFIYNKPFWGGLYRSSLAVEYDEHAEAGVGVESGEGLTRLKGPTVWFFSPPKLYALLMEIVILALILYILRRILKQRKRSEWMKKEWVAYTVQGDENVNSIAKRHGVSWRDLAKANKLKPPYTIKSGDRIKVPPKK